MYRATRDCSTVIIIFPNSFTIHVQGILIQKHLPPQNKAKQNIVDGNNGIQLIAVNSYFHMKLVPLDGPHSHS